MGQELECEWVARLRYCQPCGRCVPRALIPPVASTSSWHVHKARRAPLTPFFSTGAVRNLESIVIGKVDQLTSGIRSQYAECGRILPIGVAFTALTLDVISDYCFGQSWRCLHAPEFAPEWKRTMTNIFEPVPVVKQFPWLLSFMTALPSSLVEKMNPDMALLNSAKAVSLPLHRSVGD